MTQDELNCFCSWWWWCDIVVLIVANYKKIMKVNVSVSQKMVLVKKA